MKPAPFDYYAPTTIDETLALLAKYGYEAKILAGGQSLIPMMNFRLAQPSILVDINNVKDLSYIRSNEDGSISIGAMSRHHQVEYDPLVADRAPLIHETMPHIATVQIRSRGTFGGSIAHADPSAELATVSVALDGNFLLRRQQSERWVPASQFFVGLFTSVLEPDELLVEARFPPLPAHTGFALVEISRRPHDFALVGVAAVITLDQERKCQQGRLVFLSVGDGPVEARQATELLKGKQLSSDLIRIAAELAAERDIDPGSDIHASAAYRKHLARALARQALEKAYSRASGEELRALH